MKFRAPIQLTEEEKESISSKLPRISWPAAAAAAKKVGSLLPKVTIGKKEAPNVYDTEKK